MSKTGPYRTTPRIRQLLLAFMRAIVCEPEDLVVTDRDDTFITRCEMLLNEFPKLQRFGFLFLLSVLDWLPLFFGFGFNRFCQMHLESQRDYSDSLMNSKRAIFRESFKAIRGLIMINYFSHHDVWKYIGYDPVPYYKERIELREKLLREEAQAKQSGSAV